jgi:hypothetical protein
LAFAITNGHTIEPQQTHRAGPGMTEVCAT